MQHFQLHPLLGSVLWEQLERLVREHVEACLFGHYIQAIHTCMSITAAVGYQDMVFRHALMVILQSRPKYGHVPLVHVGTLIEPIWFSTTVAPEALGNGSHTKPSFHCRTETFSMHFLVKVNFYKDILLVDFIFLASLFDLCHDLCVVFLDEGHDDVLHWLLRLEGDAAHFLVLLPVSLLAFAAAVVRALAVSTRQ